MPTQNLKWTVSMTQAQKLARYKAWANRRTIEHVLTLPSGTAEMERDTYFGSILHTLHHNYIVDDIFRAHLLSQPHGYTTRRSRVVPSIEQFWEDVQTMDRQWIEMSDQLENGALDAVINFEFIDGTKGQMSRNEIFIHVANHSNYHRGFVDEILGRIGAEGPATDFPIYLSQMGDSFN